MKVYVVMASYSSGDGRDSEVLGVFSTKEIADQYVEERDSGSADWWTVSEYEVQEAIGG